MNRLSTAFSAFLLLSAGAVSAQTAAPVRIAEVVPYADGVGTAALRDECDWNRDLPSDIARRSKGRVVTTAEPLDSLEGPVLHLEIVFAHASGGGYTGPRGATIRGRLSGHDGGRQSFEIRRTTALGLMSACVAMERVSNKLAKDVLNWLEDPSEYPTIEEAAAAAGR